MTIMTIVHMAGQVLSSHSTSVMFPTNKTAGGNKRGDVKSAAESNQDHSSSGLTQTPKGVEFIHPAFHSPVRAV